MRMWMGIDPGKSGGIATIYTPAIDLAGDGQDVCVYKMPESDRDLLRIVDGDLSCYCYLAAIESVHSMPGQGVKSMFAFGEQFGRVKMVCAALDIPFELVRPQMWQKALGITPRKKNESKPQFKRRLVDRAKSLFPGVQVTLQTADALLLAEYARRVRA